MTIRPYTHKVAYYETDRMGVVHHSNYIRFMEEARMDFLRQIGASYEEREAAGIQSPVIAVTGRYCKTTTFADEIRVTVAVKQVKHAVLTLAYVMDVDGTRVFVGETEHCYLDHDGRILNIKKELPDFYNTLIKLMEESQKHE